jgi:hypothetical protein
MCDENFMSAKQSRWCSPSCTGKHYRLHGRASNVSAKVVRVVAAGTERWRAGQAERQRAAISEAAAANGELAKLLAEQERDARSYIVSGWAKSLDAELADDGSELHELVGSDECDPAVLIVQQEFAERVNAAVGGRTEEDVRRLDFRTLEYVAEKLRAEGLVAIPVQASERKRLNEPQTHTGSRILTRGGFGGKAKRREKVNAHRHKRPSRKPRKRWSRDDWEEAA